MGAGEDYKGAMDGWVGLLGGLGGDWGGSVGAGAAQKVSVELEKSVPSHHTRPVLGAVVLQGQ